MSLSQLNETDGTEEPCEAAIEGKRPLRTAAVVDCGGSREG